MVNGFDFPCVLGDGTHDDTAGLQAALDTRTGMVCSPAPPKACPISATLRIHSGPTLLLCRGAQEKP